MTKSEKKRSFTSGPIHSFVSRRELPRDKQQEKLPCKESLKNGIKIPVSPTGVEILLSSFAHALAGFDTAGRRTLKETTSTHTAHTTQEPPTFSSVSPKEVCVSNSCC